MVAGDREHGPVEAAQECRSLFELRTAPTVAQVSAGDHQVGPEPFDQHLRPPRDRLVVTRAEMKVGKVENAAGHAGGRLYTEVVTDESAEIFDDLYLGLRAGGAMRKQRRGEPLTTEEREALGRWQRLSTWRKAFAIGGFALGTFGLGFTLGGLIFGRWRKA
jgi:hypothetical protein